MDYIIVRVWIRPPDVYYRHCSSPITSKDISEITIIPSNEMSRLSQYLHVYLDRYEWREIQTVLKGCLFRTTRSQEKRYFIGEDGHLKWCLFFMNFLILETAIY